MGDADLTGQRHYNFEAAPPLLHCPALCADRQRTMLSSFNVQSKQMQMQAADPQLLQRTKLSLPPMKPGMKMTGHTRSASESKTTTPKGDCWNESAMNISS